MKNVIKHSKKVFIMVALLATVIGYANEPSFFIFKNDADLTILTLKYAKEGNLFSIKDENGVVLYKETIQQTGIYSKGFDLTALPDGDYFMELNKDLELRSIPFSVSSNLVTFDKENEKVFFKPYVRAKKNRILLTKLALNFEPLDVKIYYEDFNAYGGYNLIHSEEITDTQNIERIYKLDRKEKGTYKLVFNSDGRQYVEYLNI